MKNRTFKLTGLILILLIGLVIVLITKNLVFENPTVQKQRETQVEKKEVVYSVKAEKVSFTTLEKYIKLNGDVIASKSIDIYPDTSGKLSHLLVNLGDYVKKDQIIAKIDPSKPGQIFSLSPVRSTITGTITKLPFKEGATVGSNQLPLATIGDLNNLSIQSAVSEKDIKPIKTGLKAIICFEAFKEKQLIGHITEVSPVLKQQTRTLGIKIAFDKKDKDIKAGMFGAIKLITNVKKDALVISSDSILKEDGKSFVYLIKENQAQKSQIKEGIKVDGKIEVLEGLNQNDLIVSRGQSMLQDGSEINVINLDEVQSWE